MDNCPRDPLLSPYLHRTQSGGWRYQVLWVFTLCACLLILGIPTVTKVRAVLAATQQQTRMHHLSPFANTLAASPRHSLRPLKSENGEQQDRSEVSRRDTFNRALRLLAGFYGGAGLTIFGTQVLPKLLLGPPQRGVVIPGYQGQSVTIPNGIQNSFVTNALQDYEFPIAWPYKDLDFWRYDQSDDGNFYDAPRFQTHIDDDAIAAIRTFYSAIFSQAPQGEYSVLDICSSWISHYPEPLGAKRVAVTGMNKAELESNVQATDYTLRDLNKDPTLPYDSNTFDFVTNVVSVDYLIKPRQVVTEVHRVMKPGGMAVFSFSNRCFPSKVILMWGLNMEDGVGHCRIVANYFRFSPEGGWKDISCVDISANPGRSDPMWVVTAVKA